MPKPAAPEGEPPSEERFDKAFALDLALMFLFTPLILVPMIGIVLLLTFAPLLAGMRGGRHVGKRDGALAAAIAVGIWAVTMVAVIFFVMDGFRMPGATVGVTSGLELAVLAAFVALPVTFAAVGGHIGGRAGSSGPGACPT